MMNQGGMVPSHQAGIYGLSEGGRTGLRFGGNPHEASQGSPDAGQSGDHHGDVAHGEGGRFDVANQPPSGPSETAVIQVIILMFIKMKLQKRLKKL